MAQPMAAGQTRRRGLLALLGILCFAGGIILSAPGYGADIRSWQREWPNTNFSATNIDLDDIMSGGPSKDGIPSIDRPRFVALDATSKYHDTEPVIGLIINGEARAYPLSVLIWHEIVNDTVGGTPVAVTYCPLCNAAIVFDRRVDGKVLDFGTTGKLRNSDLVMYDRQTESWWQQFTGEAIVGAQLGALLKMVPARLESFALFKKRAPHGKVLVPNLDMRSYGRNPYEDYDDPSSQPFLYRGSLPRGIAPLARVVAIDGEAWSLDLLRNRKKIEVRDLVLTWESGQNSALDHRFIARGRDIGNVIVQRKGADGPVDAVYDVTFAFSFHAFYPQGKIHTR